MKSFQLEKAANQKQGTMSAGALLLILGIVGSILIEPISGGIMIVLGVILMLGAKFSS